MANLGTLMRQTADTRDKQGNEDSSITYPVILIDSNYYVEFTRAIINKKLPQGSGSTTGIWGNTIFGVWNTCQWGSAIDYEITLYEVYNQKDTFKERFDNDRFIQTTTVGSITTGSFIF